jgi:Holliday junction resolvase-like predicted endonuclease
MSLLFCIGSGGEINSLEPEPFANETEDLESFLERNPQLLGEGLTIVGRQVSTNAGRIDLLGIDQALGPGQVVIVELKNETADVRTLLQILRYGGWVASNPDSVRLILAQKRIDSKDVEMRPQLIVVAPGFEDELVELSQYVNSFEFRFIEVQRFKLSHDRYVVVNEKQASQAAPPEVHERAEWDWEKYATELNWKSDRIIFGRRVFERIQQEIARRGWPLSPRFRKGYIPFQLHGTRNVIGLEPRWAQGFAVWFRLSDSPDVLGLPSLPEGYQTAWNRNYKVYYVNLQNEDFDLAPLEPLIARAYQEATGES